ncbi:hypothetical protein A4H97_23080 [Niastella yeongjuensis]|uniref:BioF2-like acetyltransferase domain-containing protein n=1 Tax=Niastella yeongjuensis TaxID=354355 RepID=A0A1V9F6A5_9BACT|nr:GNAT family N-acetyltransferase [Niastella yeongjuensis]OQP53781.1 hypothetical protein A4H97_23080 [Niastella yeongjuensis]SEP29401.1 Acetyltransferase (GNAT) domain-containing protein [Niastella yeongjuensis]
MLQSNLQYLNRNQVDPVKWDQCIQNAPNGVIYAFSWYLDHMAPDWSALVLGDYEVVMPLPVRKKWGITYVYRPGLIAALGVFGQSLTANLVSQFIQAIPASIKLIDTCLNAGNIFSQPPEFTRLHNNFILSLQPTYEQLYNAYRDNIKRNIKRAQKLNNRYAADVPVEEVVRLARLQPHRTSHLTEADYDNFTRLYHFLYAQKKAIACGVYTAADELVASCVYFFSHNRAYYIFVGNHPNGRTQGASHFLIDRFIHDYAGTGLLLDFEGGDFSNLAFFYSSFGSQLELYPGLYVNRLPWYVKLISGKK